LGFGFAFAFAFVCGCALWGGVNVERAAGVVARAVPPALADGEVGALRVTVVDPAPGAGSGA
jgi:hypothetical protein